MLHSIMNYSLDVNLYPSSSVGFQNKAHQLTHLYLKTLNKIFTVLTNLAFMIVLSGNCLFLTFTFWYT